jgi:hypothetical protein
VDVTKAWSDVADGVRRRVGAPKWGGARSLFELALGCALVVGGAIGVVVWQREATRPDTVVIAARDLRRGDTLTVADLNTGTVVGSQGVRVPSPETLTGLLGTTVRVDIPAGAMVMPELFEQRTPPDVDEALISMALRPGEAPPDLAPLDQVRVVLVRLDPLGTAPPAITTDAAQVWAVRPATDVDPTVIVTVRTAADVLPRVALADRIRLGVVAS